MKIKTKLLSILLVVCMIAAMVPMVSAAEYPDAHKIVLSSTENEDGTWTHSAKLDGVELVEYDYTWHCDPSEQHDEVKNAPAEYYTGTKPETDAAAYVAHDIYYYPELPVDGFKQVSYDGDREWVYYYQVEGLEDYIFGNLPVSGKEVPTERMHSAEDAYQNAVLHIAQAGTYVIEGSWHGQIWIDLGDTDDTFTDPEAKVTVILNGVDVTCTVAPALVFYSVYECDNTWEDREEYTREVDTTDAGANVIIADGTVNNFTGTNIYRMLKTKYKNEDQQVREGQAKTQKKMRKIDGTFYSFVSMNIDGEEEDTGVLNINAGFEGLDTELHLTINGGNVNIYSQDDGINCNEDDVSVVTINGGRVHILAGLGAEGDGVDSNGFLVINGGTVISMAKPISDSGLDSDKGSYINGGTVVALGSTMDWAEADDSNDAGQVTMNLRFNDSQSSDEAIIVTDTDGKIVFAYDPDKDEVAGSQARSYKGAVVSCSAFEVGKSYYVYVGGDIEGTEIAGVYDVSTVTGFTADAKQQCYAGTFTTGFPGFPGPGGAPDFSGGFPSFPGPGGFPGFGGNNNSQSAEEYTSEFYMEDKVNNFSSVIDKEEAAMKAFSDVKSNSWYYDAVKYAVNSGMMNGATSTSFNPTGEVTRGMMAAILYRLAGEPEVSGKNKFADVQAGMYYEKAIIWADANGIMSGYSNSEFGPSDSITREQLATALFRYAQYKGMNAVTLAEHLAHFSDRDQISSYAVSAFQWAVGSGLIQGSNNQLSPKGTATRAQVAQILMNYSEIVSAYESAVAEVEADAE